MKKNFLFKGKALVVLGLTTALVLGGCQNASTEKEENKTSSETTSSEATSSEATSSEATSSEATSSEATSSEATSSEATSSESTSSEATSSEATSSETTDADPMSIYEDVCSDKLEYEGQLFSERFSESIEEFGEADYCFYDVDEDSQDELLVTNFYYGFEIFDVRDGEMTVLDAGTDTTSVCAIYTKDGHVYVGHSDTMHMDRDVNVFYRYDEAGQVIEVSFFMAEFPDSDSYGKDDTFYIDDKIVSMKKYEKALNKYEIVSFE